MLVNAAVLCFLCLHGGAVNEKVCSSSVSEATSHSAHLYHLPLSFSFCWQIKIHGLPSHPFSLRCLIVSKIEEITGRNLCTNKNLSGTWQRIPWHTHVHTCAWGIPPAVHSGIPQIPSFCLFNSTLLVYHAAHLKKECAGEGVSNTEGRENPSEGQMKTTRHHSAGADQLPLFLTQKSRLHYGDAGIITGSPRIFEFCDFILVKWSHGCCRRHQLSSWTSPSCVCYSEVAVTGTWWLLLTRMNESLYLRGINKH